MGRRKRQITPEVRAEIREAIEQGKRDLAAGVVRMTPPSHSTPSAPAAYPSHPQDSPSKTLSIRQPWAWLIANGHKDVENRSWPTSLRGTILIHAGKQFDFEGERWVRANFPDLPLPGHLGRWRRSDWHLGGIMGKAEIV